MLRAGIERLWFGQAADLRWPGQAAHGRTRLRGALIVLALFVGRLCLPFYPSDSRLVYEGIVWALQHQHNWGKQALVGALDYPPLPGLLLLGLSPLEALRATMAGWQLPSASAVLIAAAQVWTLVLVVRTARALIPIRGATLLGVLLFLALGLSLPVAAAAVPTVAYLLVADPFWVCLVPLAGTLLHVVSWEQNGALYHFAMAALYAGLLVLCGLTGIIFALSVLLLLARHGVPAGQPRPSHWLVFLPVGYALLLHLLFNALIMSDALFAWRRIAAYFTWPASWAALVANGQLVALLVVVVLFGVSLLWPRLPLHLRLGWHFLLAAAVCHALQRSGGLFLGGTFLFTGFALLPILLFFVNLPRCRDWRLALLLLPPSLALIPVALILRLDSLWPESFTGERPPRAALIAAVDRHWQDSRILVFGLRPAVLYAPTDQSDPKDCQRFIARLDFNENVLRADLAKEQLHLLLPPADGTCQPRHEPGLARLRHEPVPGWLLLENLWPGGWELWRCVRLPPPPTPPPAAATPPPAATPRAP